MLKGIWATACAQRLFIAFAILLPFSAFAQQPQEKWGFTASALGGYVWAHKGSVANLKAHVYGGMLGFKFQTANRKQWHRIYNKPAWGVDVLYLYYGNPNIVGSVYGLLPYIEFPFFKKFGANFNLKVNWGLGYVTQPFDVVANTDNSAIGSRLNGSLCVHGIINIPLTSKSELNLVGGLTHFSNGNFKMPNLGINSPEIKIGYTRYLKIKKVEEELPNDMDTLRNSYLITGAFASKYTDYIFPKRILVGSLQFKYLRTFSAKSKFGGGLDLFYDEGNFYVENRKGSASKGNTGKAIEVAVKVGHELQFGRLALITDIAAYLYNTNKVKGPVYQRIGLRGQITKQVGLYAALKVHFARADYFEWGVNYRINNR